MDQQLQAEQAPAIPHKAHTDWAKPIARTSSMPWKSDPDSQASMYTLICTQGGNSRAW